MEEMEKQMRGKDSVNFKYTFGCFLDLLTASTLVEINEFGIADNRPPIEGLESDLNRLNESYLQVQIKVEISKQIHLCFSYRHSVSSCLMQI
jgi:hypothetical protein